MFIIIDPPAPINFYWTKKKERKKKKRNKEEVKMNLMDRDFAPIDPDDEEEERRNFLSVLAAFRFYRYVNVTFNVNLVELN